MAETKRCPGCKTAKPRSTFWKMAASKDGLQAYCKVCQQARITADPNRSIKTWIRQIRRNFGMRPEHYFLLLQSQRGKCAICKKTEKENGKMLAVDHCHNTGEIRGLLCDSCNQGLGRLGDDLDGVQRAADYLKETSDRVR